MATLPGEGTAAPSPARPEPSRALGRLVTAIAVLILLGLVVVVVRVHLLESRLASVEHPERALALIVGRTLDAQIALSRAPAWERVIHGLTVTDASSEIGQAIIWYQELADESLAPDVDLRLAILLGEGGRAERLARVLAAWPARGEPLSTHAAVLAAAYLGQGELEAGEVGDTIEALGPGWFADAVSLRAAPRLGEPALAEAARRAQEGRARLLLVRMRLIAALEVVLAGLGLLAARALWRRRPLHAAVADAPLPPPWSLGAGLQTLVRGAALAGLIMATVLVVDHWVMARSILVDVVIQPLLYVPLLVLVWWGLLGPAGLGFGRAFGLRPRPAGWRPWVLTTAVLVSAGLVIDVGLGLLGDRLGLSSHWSEWFDADLAWGPPATVGATLLGSVVFAPVFEELVFRGLLFGTLRARLAWPLAGVASALVFSFAHGYGFGGFASVFLSGLLWAWAYERTGSLLPSMAAHAVNNVIVALTLTAMLR